MLRSVSYWFSILALAALAVQAVGSEKGAEGALDFGSSEEALVSVMPVPEPARAAFLGVGIVAVAFTYRRAWLNMKRASENR